jgi:hypothetical protein
MNRVLILALMGGIASAQTIPSSLSSLSADSAGSPWTSNAPRASETGQPAALLQSTQVVGPLPQLLPQPTGRATLVGGTISKVDRVHDTLTLAIFGGGKARIFFDARTHISRDGDAVTANALQEGQRVYLDTKSAGNITFAGNIRVVTQAPVGETTGQIVDFDPRSGELVISDSMSSGTVKLRLTSSTPISRGQNPASSNDLLAGALISATFASNGSERGVARQISILAAPGNTFHFTGRVASLDLHLGRLVVVDPRDQKSYSIEFDPSMIPITDSLREGAMVVATTAFDGRRYVASDIQVDSTSRP